LTSPSFFVAIGINKFVFYNTMAMRENIINIALSQVGTIENGPNCVKYNLEMWGRNGMPWCATFVSWCAR